MAEQQAAGQRELVRMAWPLAVGMLSFTVMGATDTLLMGRVATEAQAGVGLSATMIYMVVAFFRGLTSGAQSLVSASHGAGSMNRVRQACGSGIMLGFVSGLLATALTLLFANFLLGGLAADETVAQHANGYMTVRALGLPIALFSFAAMSCLQGLGDTRIRMWASLAGNAVNIVLDLVLIFGFGPIPALGAEGAAWATVGGVLTMALFYVWRFRTVIGWPGRPSMRVVRDCLQVGLPAGGQALVGALSFALMMALLARIGAAHLAASQIALNIISVSFLPGYGLAEAASILSSRLYGADRFHAAADAIRTARGMALVIMGACALLFVTLAEPLVALFSMDPSVQSIGCKLLWCAAAFQLFDAVVAVHLCVLRGLGDTRYTFIMTTIAGWGVMLPLTYLLAWQMQLGAVGAWMAMTVELATLSILTSWRIRGVRRGYVGRRDLLLGESTHKVVSHQ